MSENIILFTNFLKILCVKYFALFTVNLIFKDFFVKSANYWQKPLKKENKTSKIKRTNIRDTINHSRTIEKYNMGDLYTYGKTA